MRPASERGHADHGWLDARHTFSFANYYDPEHMGFRTLRVLNEDRIAPGGGFGKHPHRDMEIVTFILDGALEHGDSMGNGEIIRPGEIQRMSAGTGVIHSEVNPSNTEGTHLLQIWIEPGQLGIQPGYEQVAFDPDLASKDWLEIASPEGADGGVTIHTDARIFVTRAAAGESRTYDLEPGRHAWLQVTRGSVRLGDHELSAGDGAAVSEETRVALEATQDAEALLFDLP